MIELRSLTKRYGSFTAVNSVDLDVPRGELFGFLGPNGAGKTTTLRMIAGILRPSSGTVRIAGIDLANQPTAAKQKLGFIPDRPFIHEKLTGVEFLRFVAGLYGQSGEEVERRGGQAAVRAVQARCLVLVGPSEVRSRLARAAAGSPLTRTGA